MSSNKPKSLSEIVNASESGIAALAEGARARVALAGYLREVLPDGLGEHLLAANVNSDNCLVVLSDGPEWAARLRYESGALLSRCREQHAATVRVRIRVASDAAALREAE
jgi:hypothetical protein